jgi:hypothetical protein
VKAVDYFEEYGEAVLSESFHDKKHDELNKLFMAFVREMNETIKVRGVKTDKATVAVIKEQNQKWNSLCAIYEKKYEGMCPLKRNGFLNAMKNEIPALNRYLE